MKKILILVAALTLSACGGGEGGPSQSDTVSPWAGTYTLLIDSTQGLPCNDLIVTGTVDSDGWLSATFFELGETYQVTATVLDSGEIVAGEGTINNELFAYFYGDLINGGTFEDIYGCTGTWEAQ